MITTVEKEEPQERMPESNNDIVQYKKDPHQRVFFMVCLIHCPAITDRNLLLKGLFP